MSASDQGRRAQGKKVFVNGRGAMIIGAIDGIKLPDEISGWARDLNGTNVLTITARVKSGLVASGRTSLDRPDVGGAHGFVLRVPVEDLSGLLAKGELEVFAEDQRLELWRELSARLAAPDQNKKISVPKLPQGMREYSEIRLPIGLTCNKGTVTVGRNGHLFLAGGSNGLLSRYRDSGQTGEVERLVNEWVHLLKERVRQLQGKAEFLQIFIPEKASALPKFFPEEISAPLLLYSKLVAALRDEVEIPVFDCYPLLQGYGAYYLKLNSHLSSKGCFRIFEEILRYFGLPPPGPLEFGAKSYVSGDLASHLLGQEVLEEVTDNLVLSQPRLTSEALVLESEVRTAGHVGTRVVWKNPRAPIDKKVVAFANSFFEKGYGPNCLSWWFARWFSEYHFVWSPDVDYDYVDRVAAEIVVAQTIERFLYALPKA